MAKFSDIEVFEGLKKADPIMMSYWWDEFAPRLQYFAENLIRSKHDAEEIVSTVFLKLPDVISKFSSLDHVKSSLFISAKNKCFDYIRRRQVDQKRQLHYVSHLSETTESEESEAERAYIKTQLIHAIYKEMDRLPKKCRKIFELSYLKGMNAREVSDKLSITVSTVTTQRSRAIKLLKEVLSHKEIITILILLN